MAPTGTGLTSSRCECLLPAAAVDRSSVVCWVPGAWASGFGNVRPWGVLAFLQKLLQANTTRQQTSAPEPCQHPSNGDIRTVTWPLSFFLSACTSFSPHPPPQMVTFVWVHDLVVLVALASAGSLNVTIKGHMTQKEVPILNGCDPGIYEVKV